MKILKHHDTEKRKIENKYHGINLTKYVQGLYMGNYKSLMKNIKDLRERECMSWTQKLNIVDINSSQFDL